MIPYREDDLGAPHGQAVLVEDEEGTRWSAFYDDGTWWEGHPEQGCRVQLDLPPVTLVEQASAQ